MVKTANQHSKSNLVIGILLITFVAIIYTFNSLNKITGSINMSRVKIAETERDLDLIDKIARDKVQYDETIKLVKSTLPAEYYEVSFFTSELERLAGQNALELKIDIDQKVKEEKSSYNSVVYSLETTGGYSAVTNFLSQLARLPYHTSVDYIKIASEDNKIITSIKFRLFIQK